MGRLEKKKNTLRKRYEEKQGDESDDRWKERIVLVYQVILPWNLSEVTISNHQSAPFEHCCSSALSLVLPSRRYWCAFNEFKQRLEFYPSERDLIQGKTPIETIPLHRAAITLSTTEERVFIIL